MFRKFCFALLVVGSFHALSARSAAAQTLPSPAQALQMLQSNPAMIQQLQQMVRGSGMSADQLRARLRSQGYPESLLDQYMPGAARVDSLAIPNDDVFAAVRVLGLADSTMVDSLSRSARTRRRMRAQDDSAFLDTLRVALQNDTTASAIRAILASRGLQRQQFDSGFTVFGLDLFQEGNSQFAANPAQGGADPNYRFGPGDQLTLVITGDVEKSYPRLTVNRDGQILIPDVGFVNVSGLTRVQLDDLLYRRLGLVYSGVRRGPGATTRFLVDVGQIGVNQVYVNGDVRTPGSYRPSRAGTVMTALYMAGGPTASGSMRNVQVKRNGETVATLDIYDYALRGDAGGDVRLESGDIVFIPPRGDQVRVSGAVLRPAMYELKANESVGDVIRMAGGLTPTADRRRISVERVVPPNERTTSGRDRAMLDVQAEIMNSAPARGGDIIRVYEIAKRVSNRVTVLGNVWSPGVVGLTNGMRLQDALRRVGGLKPDAFLGSLLISRLNSDSTRTILHSGLVDTAGTPTNNIALADGDEITVFSTTEMRTQRYVTVGGAVKRAGIQIPYREGMTLRDAVLLSGGLIEGALLTEAEVASLPDTRGAGITAITMKVALDSTYLFDRGADGRLIVPAGIIVPTQPAPQILLRPYDVVSIKWQPDWQLQQTVTLRGEVQYPNDYALVTKTERLSDLLTRAGGFTSAAYPGGVVFIRKRNNIGRIGIDLPAVMRDPNNVDNLQLADGDSIFIPKFTPVVVVRGAVNSPVGVAYVRGENLDYYVRSAGGATAQGDRRRAYVTQPNGKVETSHRTLVLWQSHPQPLPGSSVVVPVKDPSDKRDWIAIATAATSILGSLVAISAILR
jgi:protein involved in polysaccharide export with SLBB domain